MIETTQNWNNYSMTWALFCQPWRIELHLRSSPTSYSRTMCTMNLLGMARQDKFGIGKQILASVVNVAITAIALTIALKRCIILLHHDVQQFHLLISQILQG